MFGLWDIFNIIDVCLDRLARLVYTWANRLCLFKGRSCCLLNWVLDVVILTTFDYHL